MKSDYSKAELDRNWSATKRIRDSMIKTRSLNRLEQRSNSKALPNIPRSNSIQPLKDAFHSRPDEKDYKKIPSVFLPLDGGPVLVFGNQNNNSGATTER